MRLGESRRHGVIFNLVFFLVCQVPEHHAGDSRERIRKFYFDYCFDETSSQDDVRNFLIAVKFVKFVNVNLSINS